MTQPNPGAPPEETARLCKSFITYKGNASLLLSTNVFENLELVGIEPTMQTTPIDAFPFPTFSLHLPNFKEVSDAWAKKQTWRVNFSAFLFRILDTAADGDMLRILNFLPNGEELQFVSEIRQKEGKHLYLSNLPELSEEDVNLKIHSITAHFAQQPKMIPFSYTGVSVFDAGTIRLPQKLSKRTARGFVADLGRRSDRYCYPQTKICLTESTVFQREAYLYVCSWTGKRKNTKMPIAKTDTE